MLFQARARHACCLHCGGEFPPRRTNQRHCGERCAKAASDKRRYQRVKLIAQKEKAPEFPPRPLISVQAD